VRLNDRNILGAIRLFVFFMLSIVVFVGCSVVPSNKIARIYKTRIVILVILGTGNSGDTILNYFPLLVESLFLSFRDLYKGISILTVSKFQAETLWINQANQQCLTLIPLR
jgi:hypothetical protein